MSTFIQNLEALSGLIATGTMLLIAILGTIYVTKNGIRKTADEAQQNAIAALQSTIIALQADVSTLRGRVEDVTKENMQLKQTIETICMALKIKGLIVTIQGEIVNIEDHNKNGIITSTRIKDVS